MIIQVVIASLFILGSLFFLAISSTGVVRLPDFYSRCHAVGKSETLGSMLLLCGLAIYNGWEINSLKLIIILVFIGIANPTATHIIAQAAFRSHLQPWILKQIKKNNDNRASDRPLENGETGDKK
jgi:multicomponent Na+:H+ antiporter subunit G